LTGLLSPSIYRDPAILLPQNLGTDVVTLCVGVPAAVMLLRDRAWGYVLAGMLLVKAATIGLWVVAMIWFSARRGFGTPAAYTGFFVLLAAIGAVLASWFLAGLVPQRENVHVRGGPQWPLSPDPRR
jgi:hypothetical protein